MRERANKKSKTKSFGIFKSIIVFIFVCLLLLLLFVTALWQNPKYLISTIESKLRAQSVHASIGKIEHTSKLGCGLYESICLSSTITRAQYDNIDFAGAHVDLVTIPVKKWYNLATPEISELKVSIDSVKIRKNKNNSSDESSFDSSQSIESHVKHFLNTILPSLPNVTEITINQLKLNEIDLPLRVNLILKKESNNTLSKLIATVKEGDLGEFTISLDNESALSVRASEFDLSGLTSLPLRIEEFSANVDLSLLSLDKIAKADFSSITGTGKVLYDTIKASVNVYGKTDALSVMVKPHSVDEAFAPFDLTLRQISSFTNFDSEAQQKVELDIHSLPLSSLTFLKPVLPRLRNLPRELSGNVSGVVKLNITDNFSLSGTELKIRDLAGSDDVVWFDELGVDVKFEQKNIYLKTTFSDSRFDIPALFPIRGQTFSGDAHIRYDTLSKTLTIDDATLENEDFNAIYAHGGIRLSDDESVELNDLNVYIDGFKADALINYVARKNVSKGFYQWLEQALQSGTVSGSVFLNGAINGFFVSDDFTFDTNFSLEQFKLSYLQENPALYIENGTLKLKNETLAVKTNQGSINDIPVKGEVVIENILEPSVNVMLNVPKTSIRSLAKTAGRSLAKPAIDKVTAHLNLTGKASMVFDLYYDLVTNLFRFNVVLKPSDTHIQAKGFKSLPIKHANGEIYITEKGFKKMILTGEVVGQPLSMDINSQTMVDGHIETSGQIDLVVAPIDFVAAIPGQSNLSRALSKSSAINGKAKFKTLFLMHDANLKSISVASDLKGAEVRLFDILQKGKNDSLPLMVDFNGDYGELSLDLKNTLGIEANIVEGQLIALTLSDDTLMPIHKEAGEISVDLHPSSIDMNQLMTFMSLFGQSKSSEKSVFKVITNVSAQQLTYGKFSLKDVTISGDLSSGIDIDSDFIKGHVKMKDDLIEGNISRVSIDTLLEQYNISEEEVSDVENSGVQSHSRPKEKNKKTLGVLPNLTVSIDEFIYKNKSLGEASIRLKNESGLNYIEDLHISSEYFYLNVTGTERQNKKGIQSKLSGEMRINVLENQLEMFMEKPIAQADNLDVLFEVGYDGRLTSIAIEKLFGSVNFHATNVRSEELSLPPAGVLKLIDWESLRRRIELDLDIDLISLSFDEITGKIKLSKELLNFEEFVAKTALANIYVRGGIDLSSKRFDKLIVTVNPKPSDLLPVIGAVASGGVGFTVGLAVDLVAGHPINQILQLDYILTGKLDSPEINANKVERVQKTDSSDESRVHENRTDR